MNWDAVLAFAAFFVVGACIALALLPADDPDVLWESPAMKRWRDALRGWLRL